MPAGKSYTSFILEDQNTIIDFIGQISTEMYDYIEEHQRDSKFVLFYKHLTHSDLATFGKATHPNSHEKNLLYYIKTDDMLEVERKTNKPFQTAHQSCIGLKMELYNLVGLPQPRETNPYAINDYMDVYVVNNNMKYFTSRYTQKVFDKLGKEVNPRSRAWDFDNLDVRLSDGQFTPIDLHVAVHGLGMEQDTDFHKIRHHLFKGDTLVLLFELPNDGSEKKMYLLFEKNPIFFSLIGEVNAAYVRYQERIRRRLINRVTGRTNAVEDLTDEVTRQEQAAWRNMLANEMMGYTQESRQIFCPLTYITADFDKLGSLFVASHIKGFSDPNTTNEEKYDVNNGLLICANADALFDKHMITINPNNGEIIYSKLISKELRKKLDFNSKVDESLLTAGRLTFLQYHFDVFNNLESKRTL